MKLGEEGSGTQEELGDEYDQNMFFFKFSKKKYDLKLQQCSTHKKYSGEGYYC